MRGAQLSAGYTVSNTYSKPPLYDAILRSFAPTTPRVMQQQHQKTSASGKPDADLFIARTDRHATRDRHDLSSTNQPAGQSDSWARKRGAQLSARYTVNTQNTKWWRTTRVGKTRRRSIARTDMPHDYH